MRHGQVRSESEGQAVYADGEVRLAGGAGIVEGVRYGEANCSKTRIGRYSHVDA